MRRIPLMLGIMCAAVLLFAQNQWDYRDHPNWDRSWNQRPVPKAGACFFKDAGFQGDRFCVARGDRLTGCPETLEITFRRCEFLVVRASSFLTTATLQVAARSFEMASPIFARKNFGTGIPGTTGSRRSLFDKKAGFDQGWFR